MKIEINNIFNAFDEVKANDDGSLEIYSGKIQLKFAANINDFRSHSAFYFPSILLISKFIIMIKSLSDWNAIFSINKYFIMLEDTNFWIIFLLISEFVATMAKSIFKFNLLIFLKK